jgi:hypothetical protein
MTLQNWYKRLIFGLILLFCLLNPYAHSQAGGLFNTLSDKKIERLTIQVNWDSLILNKNSAKEWDAVVELFSPDGERLTLKAKLNVRGKFRRRICDIPPLDIDFKKKSLRKQDIDDYNDNYKLVSHCSDDLINYELVTQEALLYKLYQLVSPISFRIHELEVVYLNESGKRVSKANGFIIESVDELEHRLDMEELDNYGRCDSVELSHYIRLALFQAMIANHDWDVDMLKNIKLLRQKDRSYVAAPYDFDFSGWLRAPYWSARSDLNLTKPEDRYLFIDEDVSVELIAEQLDYIHSLKNDMIILVNADTNLSKKRKKHMVRQIEDFIALKDLILQGQRQFLDN